MDGPDWGGVLHLVRLHLVGEELAAAGGAVGKCIKVGLPGKLILR